MKKRLRALFIDVDDTVFSTTEFSNLARMNAVKAMIEAGLQVPIDEVLHELDEVIREFSSNHERHFDKLIRRFPRDTCGGANEEILVAAGMVAYHQTKFRNFSPFEDAISVLQELKGKLKIGIITAGVGIKQAEKIYRLGLHKIVEQNLIYITDTVGISKTNPKLFLRACRDAKVDTSEAMYVGDNHPVDVDVPKSIGMRAALSRREGKYAAVKGDREPDHIIHNFYDLNDILQHEYDLL